MRIHTGLSDNNTPSIFRSTTRLRLKLWRTGVVRLSEGCTDGAGQPDCVSTRWVLPFVLARRAIGFVETNARDFRASYLPRFWKTEQSPNDAKNPAAQLDHLREPVLNSFVPHHQLLPARGHRPTNITRFGRSEGSSDDTWSLN